MVFKKWGWHWFSEGHTAHTERYLSQGHMLVSHWPCLNTQQSSMVYVEVKFFLLYNL